MSAPSTAEPYFLDASFERAVATLCASRPRFMARIGRELDPACLRIPAASLAIQAAQAIFRETGKGPASASLVLQRLQRWRDDGRVKLTEIEAVDDLFTAATDAGLPSEDAACAELVPVLQVRIMREATVASIEDYKNRAPDFEGTQKQIDRLRALGAREDDLGLEIGGEEFVEEIEAIERMERLPIGIDDLDAQLRGGPPQGTTSLFIGGTGTGKSMSLAHVAATAARYEMFTAVATLELARPDWSARYVANLTGIPIDDVLANPRRAMAALAQIRGLGPTRIKKFPAGATTFPDLTAWVSLLEAQRGRPIDLLVIDIPGHLTTPKRLAGKSTSNEAGGEVATAMRMYASEGHPGGKIWIWGGAQPQRGARDKKKIDTDDIANSIEVARLSELVITLRTDDDEARSCEWFVAKNTYGTDRVTVGPLPMDLARGRVGPSAMFSDPARAVRRRGLRVIDGGRSGA